MKSMSLSRAAFLGELPQVVQLLASGANPNEVSEFGESALTLALEGAHRNEEDQAWTGGHEHAEILHELLASGASVTGSENEHLLQNAVRLKNPSLFEILLNKGADPNASDGHLTALALASALGRL